MAESQTSPGVLTVTEPHTIPGVLTFQDIFCCSMCNKVTASPLYFPCGDIVCKTCLENCTLALAENDDDFDALSEPAECPVCTTPITGVKLPPPVINLDVFKGLNLGRELEPEIRGSESGTTLHQRRELMPRKPTTQQAFCTICILDNLMVVAELQCLDCLEFLCDVCSLAHHKTRFTRNHLIVKLVDIKAGTKEIERKKRYRLPCDIHRNKPLEVYCLPCAQMLCLQCKLVSHNNHVCSDLSAAANEQRNKLTSDQNLLVNNINQIEELIVQYHDKSRKAKARRNKLVDGIQLRLSYFKQQLDLYMERLISQADKHYGLVIEQSKTNEDELREQISNLTSLIILTSRLSMNGTDVELLACKRQYSEKISRYSDGHNLPTLSHSEELYLNFPHTKDLAIGVIFGYLTPLKSGDGLMVDTTTLGGISGLCCGDDDRLPHLSNSGRIYEAELDIRKGVLAPPVPQTDYKRSTTFKEKKEDTPVKVNALRLVIGKPKHIFTQKCLPNHCSVARLAIMSNNDIVAAVFSRNYNFSQTRLCTRVRLQIYRKSGQIKLDIAYGAVIYGLVIGKEDQIIVSGGQCDQKNIDVIWRDGKEATNFSTRCEPGGVGIDSDGHIAVAGEKTVEYYTMEGDFTHSFTDDFTNWHKHKIKGFEHIRKEIFVNPENNVYISDANTNGVRGYNSKGELLFRYGDFSHGVTPVINPRGLFVDEFKQILVSDISSNSLHVLNAMGSFQCKILEGEITEPRDVVCYDGCYIAVAQNSGVLESYQYMFDRDDRSRVTSTAVDKYAAPDKEYEGN